jgi:hypothetical protein
MSYHIHDLSYRGAASILQSFVLSIMISTATWRYESSPNRGTSRPRGNNLKPHESCSLCRCEISFSLAPTKKNITLFPPNYIRKLRPLSHSLFLFQCFLHFLSRRGDLQIGSALGFWLHRMVTIYHKFRLCRLAWYFVVLLPCWSTAQQTVPSRGVAEIDLVFPHNDTYAPTLLMPIVFALQNTTLAALLELSFEWYVQRVGNTSPEGKYVGNINGHFLNFTGSNDAFFTYDYSLNPNATEGIWELGWAVLAETCDGEGRIAIVYNTTTIFTTKNGAQMPDFVAATADDTCKRMDSVAFNVGAIIPSPTGDAPRGGECTIVATDSPTPTPSPCKVKVNDTAASSISAGITSYACGGLVPSWTSKLGCKPYPEPTWTYTPVSPKKNIGVRLEYALVGGMAWTIATLSSLLHILLL